MKRLFIFFTSALLLAGCKTLLKAPTSDIKGNIYQYNYVYVIPTSGVTSSSGVYGNQYGVYGGDTKTINPSEVISGYFMKNGYTILPELDVNLVGKTMVISYGYTGRRKLSLFSYASGVIIQFRDAKTHELIATCEGEGCGEDETDDILQAIYSALNKLMNSISKKATYLNISVVEINANDVTINITNTTQAALHYVDLYIYYHLNGECIHKQKTRVYIPQPLSPGKSCVRGVQRDKEASSPDMDVTLEVIGCE